MDVALTAGLIAGWTVAGMLIIVAGMLAWSCTDDLLFQLLSWLRRHQRAPQLTTEQQIQQLEHHASEYEKIRMWGHSPIWNDHFGWMAEPIRDPQPDWMEIAAKTIIKHLPANAHRVTIDETIIHRDAAGNVVIDESCVHGRQWTEGQCPCGYVDECAVHCGPGHTNGQCPPLTPAVRYSR